ncbi:MAG TPA: 50S ribosomal protein L4 [Candidatus Desulfovibrio intestinigallinarum]|uniref:50S ribosomal protein L4 n=1 Tax=uncultured Desulfovibrio sp. TaxID=167968 RepID=UPI001C3BA269|nr:50S ribosomal protein L4 [uncultured Desulfovibrio sp.]HIX40607.1 50S ribosomal protein L4 [Candidatus Desulfovibrio intestinigallinarum]HJA75557.1 50S ribosomal protein L4 [Candidatus Desulfovibrio gallistercoris]
MATITVFDQNKVKAGEVTLAPEVFEVEARPEILNLVVRAQMAAKRAGTHQTKTRAFVSGGGNKPWKQKGTGRARSGSNRSPIWRGGAIIFGPQPRDYSFKVNSKVRALALKMALSSRLAAENLMVVKAIELPEAKTKHFAKVADTLGLTKALIVTPEDNEALTRSARNIPGLTLTTPDRLSVLEVLRHKQLVLLEGAVSPVQARFEKKGA